MSEEEGGRGEGNVRGREKGRKIKRECASSGVGGK